MDGISVLSDTVSDPVLLHRSTIIRRQSECSLIRSGCLIHNGTYLTLSLTLTITLTLLTLTVTVRVTLTLPTLLTLILDIGLSNPRIIEPSDYRYITKQTNDSAVSQLGHSALMMMMMMMMMS